MRSLSLIVCATAFATSAATSLAQQPAPTPQPSRPRIIVPGGDNCVTTEPGRVECRRTVERGMGGFPIDSALSRRAALGMQLSSTGTVRDTIGVFVAAVTPKGPAENAGIVEGDRIVAINGVDLRVARGDIDDPYANGLASHRLSREVGKLLPGARVNLRVSSSGRVRDVQVTAGRASDLMRQRSFFSIGDGGPGNAFIFRNGMTMPPIPPMPPMAEMAPMAPMPPEPGMYKVEMAPMAEMRLMDSMRLLERLRSIEKHQKAKVDSL